MNMDLHLNGRVAAVAAASKGLGRAVAIELAREGTQVAICSRDEARIKAAAREIQGMTGQDVLAVVADVSTAAGCTDFIAQTRARFGRLDILVANAGGPPSGPADSFSDAQWLDALNLNLLSTVRLVYAALPYLKESGQGRVIAITSMSAKQPLDGLVMGNVARSGVLAFVKTLANELGSTGVTFNSVLPGWTHTGRVDELLNAQSKQRQVSVAEAAAAITNSIPARRMGSVEEFAATVAFLASERAGYLNGVALAIDGGRSQSLY